MTLTKTHWTYPAPVPDSFRSLCSVFSPAFQSILYQRGFRTSTQIQRFLQRDLPTDVAGKELKDLEKAAALLARAIQSEKKIAVIGDYDTDGITATALIVGALRSLECDVQPFLPHRTEDGYGVSETSIHQCHQDDIDLIITVDCGIRDLDEIDLAKQFQMQVILTDHHLPNKSLPQADVILNPNRRDDPYPNKDLAGVGVAYKLVEKLSTYFSDLEPDNYLDLVAIGTVGDVVPLLGENRFLVSRGLSRLNQNHRQGLLSLILAAGLTPTKVSTADIAYQISPRLNAPGRLDSADLSLELITNPDPQQTGYLAQKLEILNQRRKEKTGLVIHAVSKKLPEKSSLPPLLFAADEAYHPGIIGIAAGHFTNRYHRPTIIGTIQGPETTASCRSIPGFNILEALHRFQDHLIRYGGHSLAAGFTVPTAKLATLRSGLIETAAAALDDDMLLAQTRIDAQVPLDWLGEDLFEEIKQLEPTGESNPEVKLLTRNLDIIQKRQVGKDKSHLKLVVSDGQVSFPAIGFGFGEICSRLPKKVDLVYSFEENFYRGKRSLQLRIIDISAPTL